MFRRCSAAITGAIFTTSGRVPRTAKIMSAARLDGGEELLGHPLVARLREVDAIAEMLGRHVGEIDDLQPAFLGDAAVGVVQLLDRLVHLPRLAGRAEAALARKRREIDEPAERAA